MGGADVYERVLELAKRRGFVYPAFELYGGAAGFYDYGPLGAQLKALVEEKFRRLYVVEQGAAEIATPAITIEPVLKASGHVDHFSDVVVTCKKCGAGHRADHLIPEELVRIDERVQKSKATTGQRQEFHRLVETWVAEIKAHPAIGKIEQIRHTSVTEDASDASRILALPAAENFVVDVGGVKDGWRCGNCQATQYEPAAPFNLMFKTHLGPGTGKAAYLRPETAQAMFVDFPLLYRHFREQLPFAACQIGRAYRNEISPRQGLIRLREFNQMEVEAFFDPGRDPRKMTHPGWNRVRKTTLALVPNTTQQPATMTIGDAVKQKIVYNAALGYHLALVRRLLVEVGLDPARLRFRQHLKDEMAHYAADCWDAEFESARFGWVECVGVAYRTDFDLAQHAKHSGKALEALRRFAEPLVRERTKIVPVPARLGPLFKKDAPRIAEALAALDDAAAARARDAPHLDVAVDGTTHRVPRDAYEVQQETERVHGEPFVPHVVEPSYGVDRILYAILEHNHRETTKEGEAYTVLGLPFDMAPVTVGVFPLMPKDGLDALARTVAEKLKRSGFRVAYDDAGAIGRRYARVDEVGAPFAVTIDYDSLKDRTVTLRDRDTTQQVRLPVGRLAGELRRRLVAPKAAATPPVPSPSSPPAA